MFMFLLVPAFFFEDTKEMGYNYKEETPKGYWNHNTIHHLSK